MPGTFISQDALDYSNDAQVRVSVDARAIVERATIDIIMGQVEYELPDRVVKILAALDSSMQPLLPLQMDDALALISGGDITGTISGYYCLQPGVIGVLPAASEDATLTLYYQARTSPAQSGAEFELTDDYEALIERVMLSEKLDDDGQPELAAYQQDYYEVESGRLRRLRVDEQPGQLRVAH